MINRFISSQTADIGTIGFQEALDLQHRLRDLREHDAIGDTILFLDHPSVYTIGRHPNADNFTGIDAIETERGGDVTYHGPGQLVIYPIIKIEKSGHIDVRKFVNDIQVVIIKSIEDLGFHYHLGDEPGIWAYDTPNGDKKVASLGMAIVKGTSFHGVSINISEDVLEGFSRIRPCGMDPGVIGYLNVDRNSMVGAVRNNLMDFLPSSKHLSKEEFYEFYSTLKN